MHLQWLPLRACRDIYRSFTSPELPLSLSRSDPCSSGYIMMNIGLAQLFLLNFVDHPADYFGRFVKVKDK